ncbi:MAG: hypothetical protein JW939_07990 [Candidatus Thermoplasmatota archaeon]|nr:hypothetical protein [Candidatus Thermoplasmatota archaeon]
MADSRTVRMLDLKLMEEGILSKDYKNDYQTVHDMLNSYMRRSGGKLPDENFKIGDRKLRDWLMILYKQGASQEKLTSYLRCGLGHLSFDYIASQKPGISASDLVTRSLQSLKLRKFHKSFFRVSKQKEKTTISLKKK